jgi:type I restriction enzyme S subunit
MMKSNSNSVWHEVLLDDVADELTVGHVGPMASEYVENGIPFLRSQNVEPLRINTNDLKFITPEFHARIRKSRLKPGDVVIVRTGKPGACSVIPEWLPDANCSDLVIVRCGKELNNRFLAYYVNTVASGHVAAHLVGAVQQHFNVRSARMLQINLPPVAEQEAIAAVLGALDDKIELNRRMNATLEVMARALFQSWFVDYDPVRAKLDGRQPIGLDPATATLFPNEFQDSELGLIPKSWRACTLGEIAENASITFDYKNTPQVVFINTGDVLEGDFLHSKRSAHTGLPGQAKKSIQPNDILFSEIRPANKRYAFVDFDSRDYVVSTKFMIIRGSKNIHPRLLYRILTAKETLNEFQVQAESRSGTFPQITFESISHLPIVLPPMDIQEAFQRAVGNVDAQIKVNKQQSRTLAAIRDALLRKLLRGEIQPERAASIQTQ